MDSLAASRERGACNVNKAASQYRAGSWWLVDPLLPPQLSLSLSLSLSLPQLCAQAANEHTYDLVREGVVVFLGALAKHLAPVRMCTGRVCYP